MCKYCMAIHGGQEAQSEFFKEQTVDELNISGNEVILSGYLGADDSHIPFLNICMCRLDGDEFQAFPYRIHYCPFCGQKLDLVEVD